MEWFSICFYACLIFFLLKTIISWVFGEFDVDFDADGDVDFDVSSMFSFKGVLHFALGFFSFLQFAAKFKYTNDAAVTFSVGDYISAILIGILFAFVLFYLYKIMMKLNHYASSEIDIAGCSCTIMINIGNEYYDVLVKTPRGNIKMTLKALPGCSNYKIGSKHTIVKVDGEYIIQ